MLEEFLKIITIFLLTMFKFIAGPTLGYAAGLSYLISVWITFSGMMSSVFVFTFLGELLRERFIKRYFAPRRVFTKRSRRFVKVWNKFGVIGVALLTPIILTPIGGTIMLTSTGTKRRKIILYMTISAFFWSFVITALVYLFADTLFKDYF